MLLGCWQVIIRPPWHPVFFKTHIGVLVRIVHLVPQILKLLSELKELPSKKYRTLFKSWHVVYNWSPSRLPDGLTTLWVGYSAEEQLLAAYLLVRLAIPQENRHLFHVPCTSGYIYLPQKKLKSKKSTSKSLLVFFNLIFTDSPTSS